MSKFKFTSGPLHVETKWKPYVIQKDGIVLAETWENSVISRAEAEANAHLYAAAPEMYKELFRLSALFRKNSIYLDEREKIETILRKARGESEKQK